MSSIPFKVKAIFEYNSGIDDDLIFPNGQIITVTEEEGDDWYVGEYMDASGDKQNGLFPRNFVEKYEPAAPPRPVRSRPKKDVIAADEPDVGPDTHSTEEPQASARIIEPTPVYQHQPVEEKPIAAPPPKVEVPDPEPPKHIQATKTAPPPVADKPSSFKDRIAAFNKGNQAPVAPIKPLAPAGGTGFIKKPFVAPPPSRDAYVAPAQQQAPVQKVYRREEDPEITERQAQNQEDAERAGLASNTGGEGEDMPKPTSLKERIALLQKQQQEQAARRADLVQHKEKPKMPIKKRTESNDTISVPVDVETVELARSPTGGSAQRVSIDSSREVSRPTARRQSRDQRAYDPRAREVVSDGNEADQSGAGDTTEEAEVSTEVEDSDERMRTSAPAPAGRMPGGPPSRTTSYDTHAEFREEEEDAEEDDDEAAEVRRKEELRQRMAKMSGGMGMAGMFGAPMGASMAGPSPRAKRPSGSSGDYRPSMDQTPASPTQRVPMIPMAGMQMQRAESPEPVDAETAVEQEPEQVLPITAGRNAEEVTDVEDLAPRRAPTMRQDVRSLPPQAPQGKLHFFGAPKTREDRRRSLLRSRSIDFRHHCGNSTYSAYDGAPIMQLIAGVGKRPVPSIPSALQQGPAPPPPAHAERSMPPAFDTRPVPPPPARVIRSPSPGSESDDEASLRPSQPIAMSTPLPAREESFRAPPPPIPTNIPGRPDGPRSPPPSSATRISFLPESGSPFTPSQPVGDNRMSRGAPPVPTGMPSMPPPGELRAPPPPPPTAVPQMRAPAVPQYLPPANNDNTDEGESEYEGDYDTDIASGATHREALKSYGREDEDRLSETTPTRVTMVGPPPVPQAGPPPMQRAAPPPPPHQLPPRTSADAPRNIPPAPPPREPQEGDYDPYRYTGPVHGAPTSGVAPGPWMPDRPIPETIIQASDPRLYGPPPPQRPMDRAPPLPPQGPPPPQERTFAQPPPMVQQGPPPPPSFAGPPRGSREMPRQSMDTKQSLDVSRPAPVSNMSNVSRKSMDQSRPSVDQAFIAQEVDLGENSLWWTQPNMPPPVFQNRNDVLCEFEESSTSKRGGRTTINKDVYVLFQDYSQTFITARFDSKDTADIALEQRHEGPPPRPRQEKLEAFHRQFGPAIAAAASSRVNHAIGDGSPHALIIDVLRKIPGVLQPVGTRAYGALVYANLANATVQQFDEIRPGDIITFRNAKFQGKHGAMHNKYAEDVGKPDHVAVVAEWDGTKKKVRAFEQGREKRGVRAESFRVTDLRSGEVKVWRVVGRAWVGWEGGA